MARRPARSASRPALPKRGRKPTAPPRSSSVAARSCSRPTTGCVGASCGRSTPAAPRRRTWASAAGRRSPPRTRSWGAPSRSPERRRRGHGGTAALGHRSADAGGRRAVFARGEHRDHGGDRGPHKRPQADGGPRSHCRAMRHSSAFAPQCKRSLRAPRCPRASTSRVGRTGRWGVESVAAFQLQATLGLVTSSSCRRMAKSAMMPRSAATSIAWSASV